MSRGEAPELARLRAEIDAVDRELVALLGRRTAVVRRVGEIKRDRAAVPAPARVEEVLDHVRTLARDHDVPEAVAVETYRAMIAALTRMQMEMLRARGG